MVPRVVLLLVMASVAQARSPRSDAARTALSHSVRVRVEKGGDVRRVASGVVVAKSQVLTNAHVVAGLDGASDVELLVVAGAARRPARVLASGRVPELDLALLEVEGLDLPAARLADDADLVVGEDVVVIGSPFGKALTVSAGIISQLEEGAMKTDAPIAYGSSGGGVFSVPGGKLVGLVEGYRTARVSLDEKRGFDVPMPGETFLAPLSKVRAFLKNVPSPRPSPGGTR